MVASIAALYSDGARNPVIFLDNLEMKQMTDELMTFLITSATGISKEKRRAGTESETTVERTNCLINTSGIEPLGASLTEVLSRTFTLVFETPKGVSSFVESETIGAIQRNRNMLLSGLFQLTRMALCEMHYHNAQSRIMQAIARALPDHSKARCNDYLALMYLIFNVDEFDKPTTPETTCLPDEIEETFRDLIVAMNKTSAELAEDSNPIVAALNALYRDHETAVDLDRKEPTYSSQLSRVNRFREEFQVTIDDTGEMGPLTSTVALSALRTVAKKHSIDFPYKGSSQFSHRLMNDLDVVKAAGINVVVGKEPSSHRRTYTFSPNARCKANATD
jgi:protein-tyrosine-phosphatase